MLQSADPERLSNKEGSMGGGNMNLPGKEKYKRHCEWAGVGRDGNRRHPVRRGRRERELGGTTGMVGGSNSRAG